MKRSSLKYILIVFVIIVWGIVFYKVIKVIRGSEITANHNIVFTKSDSTHRTVDTFSIIANYPDPFLRRSIAQATSEKKGINKEKKVKSPVDAQKKMPSFKNWPNIIYAGLVSNPGGNKSTVLITINGAGNIMKKGDVTNEIEVIAITRDSVKLRFQSEYRYIKRYGTK